MQESPKQEPGNHVISANRGTMPEEQDVSDVIVSEGISTDETVEMESESTNNTDGTVPFVYVDSSDERLTDDRALVSNQAEALTTEKFSIDTVEVTTEPVAESSNNEAESDATSQRSDIGTGGETKVDEIM